MLWTSTTCDLEARSALTGKGVGGDMMQVSKLTWTEPWQGS